eukprot:5676378-Heterocapsa_arctica.AAC.2
MKESAEKEFDPKCLKQTSKINPQCHIVGKTIFDQLVGAPRAKKREQGGLHIEGIQHGELGPMAKIIEFIRDEAVWGAISDADFCGTSSWAPSTGT